MHEPVDDSVARSKPLWLNRGIRVGLVLLGEYLLLSFCFDAQPVVERGGIWLAFSGMGTAGLIAVLVLISAALLRPLFKLELTSAPAAVSRRLLAVHALAYGALFILTWLMLGNSDAPRGSATLWIIAWFCSGILSFVTLLVSLLGYRIVKSKLVLTAGFAACLVGLAIWEAGRLSQWLWIPLSHSTLGVVAMLLRLAFPSGARGPEGVIVGLFDFTVRVDPVCSGFEGMGLAAVLTVAYWFTFRKDLRFPNAYLLLPIGVALAWLGNIVRILTLLILGAFVNPQLAIGAFHSKAGWVMFCAIALAIGTLGRRLSFFSKAAHVSSQPWENPTVAYVLPLVVLVGTALVTGLFAETYDRAYVLRLLAAVTAIFVLRRYYRQFEWGWAWLPYVVGALVALMWLVVPVPKAQPLRLDAAGQGASISWIAFRALGSVIIVPFCEELAFRGFMMRWIISRDFTRVAFSAVAPSAIVVSSLTFGLLHERWLVATIAGAAYAVAQIRGGRIWDAVIAHVTSNAIIAAWVLMTNNYTYWVQ